MKIYLLFLILSRVRSQEVSTPSSLLQPRNYNHHPFDAEQFLKSLNLPEPTKQGPVLFPNDGPPPPRNPLIVTSRPLLESIARSELGQNNTVTSQSQVNGQRVSYLPYLARVSDYRPYSPAIRYNFVPTQIPYADVARKSRLNALQRDNRYNDYEEQTILPPIYRALSDHAKEKVLKIKQTNDFNHYKSPVIDHSGNYENNNLNDEISEYDQNQNYAFSYTVKDKKTGDDFSHSQQSSGSATNGEYRVRLPDGRMQIVSYTADENGYKADVRYDEEKLVGNSVDYQGNTNNNNNYKPQNDYTNANSDKAYYDKNINHYIQSNKNNADIVYPKINNNHAYVNNDNLDFIDRSRITNNNNLENKDIEPGNEREDYYHYPDISKEYSDYSSEYNSNYDPHKSKFSAFNINGNVDVPNENVNVINEQTAATVKPSYEELKGLFVNSGIYSTQQNYNPVELKVPSTTPVPYDGTTEHVVVIGTKSPNLYTNIRNSISNNVLSYPTPRVVVATTPRSYLVSTIASLKNRVHLANKPILSDRFIDKINKYLSFN